MPFWCIDPTNGVDGAQGGQATQALAEASPYKTLAAVETALPAAGDSILWIGGDLALGLHTLDAGTDGSSGSPIIFGSYGTGKGGVDANGDVSGIATNSNVYLNFESLELTGSDGTGNDCLYVTGGNAVSVNIVVDSCDVHAPIPNDISGSGTGIDIRAANVEIFDTEVYDCPDDAIYCEGNDVEVHHNYIHDIDQHPTDKGGDCLKFSAGVGSLCLRSHAHHNIFDHSNNNRKQALIMAGNSGNQTGEHNKCLGGEFTISSKADNNIVRRNLVVPKAPGSEYGTVITYTRGINFEVGANQICESNIVSTVVGDEPHWGIRCLVAGVTIQGNVIYGPMKDTGSAGALGNEGSIQLGSGATSGTIIRNNIIGGRGNDLGFHINASNPNTITECDYNIYTEDGKFLYLNVTYADFADWKLNNPSGFDANSILLSDIGLTADDLFRDHANGDFRLNEGQEILGAQIGYADFLGRRNFPTIIGAYIQPLTNSSGTLTNLYGTVDTTIGTVLSTDGSLVDEKYPEWGIRT